MILIPQERLPKWTARDGSQVPICQVENRHLVKILQLMKRHAEIKKSLCEQAYDELPIEFSPIMGVLARDSETKDWDCYVCNEFHDLRQEAKKRGLIWDTAPKQEPLDRPALRRAITGALKDAIASHGPVNQKTISSAVKRIMGQIRTYMLGSKR